MKQKPIAIALLQLIIFLPLTQSVFAQTSPQITLVELEDFTASSTTISWTTTIDADSTVMYGETAADNERTDSAFSKQHRLTISTQNGKTYKYIVKSCTPANECSQTTLSEFVAGPDTTAPMIDVTIPHFVNSHRLNIQGKTEPYSEVSVFVNNMLSALQSPRSVGGNGIISIGNVGLTRIENSVEVRAKDSAGNINSKLFDVKVDTVPVSLTIINFKDTSQNAQFTANGMVNENSIVEFYVTPVGDNILPPEITDVVLDEISAASTKIAWDASNATDLLEYAVYRNDKRIAVTQSAFFSDTNITSGQTYRYRISAIDKSCNEGLLSDALPVTIPSGSQTGEEYSEARLSCELPVASLTTDASFTQSLTISEGNNRIRIIAKDIAGNEAVYENITLYDTKDPTFESTNLNALSPSYIKDVHIKGKVSEKATVFVYINGRRSTFWSLTDDEGNFYIPVELERSLAVIGGAETAWSNKIKLLAVDLAGREAQTPETEVIYALCGYGTDFSTTAGAPMPSDITPRDVVEGFARTSFNIQFSYDRNKVELRSPPTLRIRPLSQNELENWDTNILPNALQWSSDGQTAYAVLNINAPQYPPDVNTTSEKEEFVANHRKDECGIPGYGCYKIPLELEIKYNRIRERAPGETSITGQMGPSVAEMVQKSCIEITIGIQPTVDVGDMVNERFLRNRVMDIDNIILFIDQLKEPMELINTYVFYTCAMAIIAEFAYDLWTEASEYALQVYGRRNFDRDVAKSGLCDWVYDEENAKNSQEEAKIKKQNSNCNNYAASLVRLDRIKRAKRHICDRVMCVSAPTLRKYVTDKQKGTLKKIIINSGSLQIEVYSGSDCAGKQLIKPEEWSSMVKLYESWNIHKSDSGGSVFGETTGANFEGSPSNVKIYGEPGDTTSNINCAKLHPSSPACCGYEYVKEYGSACDLPGFYTTTFDEITESTCVAAQTAGQRIDACTGLSLRSLTNALAGICTSRTTTRGVVKQQEIVQTGLQFQSGTEEGQFNPELTSRLETTEVFILVNQQSNSVQRGYIGRAYEFRNVSGSEALDSRRNFVSDIDLTQHFRSSGRQSQYTPQFQTDLCKGLGSQCTREKAQRIFDSVKSKFIGTENEYIVDPTRGFLRTIQCLCLPGFISYLTLWRNILTMARNCLEQIRVTGHGTEGSCEAFLSTYLCDMIWDIIKCVYTTIGGGPITSRVDVSSRAGIERIFGIFTDVGDRIAGSTTERYGSTPIFTALFSERNLVHSMCMFAFTGRFDLAESFASAVERASTTGIPVNSQGLLSVAERRFFSYDLTSRPQGQASFSYRIAAMLNAGADLDYKIKLKCSDDMSCSEASGHKLGRCDCVGIGAKEQTIKQGHLNRFEMLNEEIYHPPATTPYRYDTVIMAWEWKDSNNQQKTDSATKTIHEQSGTPASCSLNLMELKFLCAAGAAAYYAKFTGDIVPAYPTNKDEFTAAADNMMFSVPLHQTYPTVNVGALASEHTKYLLYEVYNQRSQRVASNYQTAAEARQNLSAAQAVTLTDANPLTEMFILMADGPSVKTVTLGQPNKQWFGAGTGIDFTVGLTPDVWGANVVVVDGAKVRTNLVPKLNQIISYSFNAAQNKFFVEGRGLTLANQAITDSYYGIKIENIPIGTTTISIMPYQLATQTCTPGTAETWVAKFEIHDSILDGGSWKPSTQLTHDLNGMPQLKRANFKVKC